MGEGRGRGRARTRAGRPCPAGRPCTATAGRSVGGRRGGNGEVHARGDRHAALASMLGNESTRKPSAVGPEAVGWGIPRRAAPEAVDLGDAVRGAGRGSAAAA